MLKLVKMCLLLLFSTLNACIIILMICSHNKHHVPHIVISFLRYQTVRSFVSQIFSFF